LEENSPRVNQYAAVLDSLEAKCQEDREKIGEIILQVHATLLKQGGNGGDLLEVAHHLDNNIPEPCGESEDS